MMLIHHVTGVSRLSQTHEKDLLCAKLVDVVGVAPTIAEAPVLQTGMGHYSPIEHPLKIADTLR